MSEFAPNPHKPTPDHILKSRALSDAELLHGGADYENGVLKPTAEQVETIRYRYEAQLGRIGLDLSGVVLHTEKISDLNYLHSETAVENEARLNAEIHDLTSRYVEAVKQYFPTKIKRFSDTATNYHETTVDQAGSRVNYKVGFHARKYETDDGEKVARPAVLVVGLDRYGRYGSSNDRDTANYYLDETGEMTGISLTTTPVSQEAGYLHQVAERSSGKHNEGVVPELVGIIDGSAFPATQIYEKNRFDDQYQAYVGLKENEYSLVFHKSVKRQITHARHLKTEVVKYNYDPRRDSFVKDKSSTWDMGPEEIETSSFKNIVHKALSNIPTIET